MDLKSAKQVSAAGMAAQAKRLRIVSENLANASSTSQTPGGDPYRRKLVTFKNVLDRQKGVEIVKADQQSKDMSPFPLKYEPTHPAADKNGYVKMPNVNTLMEMMDMREAQRSYEANLGALQTSRKMTQQMVDLLQ